MAVIKGSIEASLINIFKNDRLYQTDRNSDPESNVLKHKKINVAMYAHLPTSGKGYQRAF